MNDNDKISAELSQLAAREKDLKPPSGRSTASDTADWYRLGDAVEKHGRHMKRQAVAAEYNSGRNMEAWYREVGLPSDTGKDLLKECRKVGLLGGVTTPCDSEQLSQALPTQAAAREYAKAPAEVKEAIKEIIREDPETEIKAADIKRLVADHQPTEPEAPKLAVLASEPLVAAAVEELQNPLAAVIAYAVATAEPAHPDANKIVELLSAARQLLQKHYRRDEISSDEWESIYAHWYGCSYCIKSEHNHYHNSGFNREGAVEVDCREA